MDALGEHVLADAGLAQDEHVDRRARDGIGLAVERDHRGEKRKTAPCPSVSEASGAAAMSDPADMPSRGYRASVRSPRSRLTQREHDTSGDGVRVGLRGMRSSASTRVWTGAEHVERLSPRR